MTKEKTKDDLFGDMESLQRPRNIAFSNWFKAEKVGDTVQGYIVDVFYRPQEAKFKPARGITLKQTNGEFINVSIKRLPFVLALTDDLHLGDPLKVVFEKELTPKVNGYSPTKQFAYYGKKLPENAGNKTVRELDAEDMAHWQNAPQDTEDEEELKKF